MQAHRNRRIRFVPDSSGVPYEYPIPQTPRRGSGVHTAAMSRVRAATIEHEQNTAGFDGEEKDIDMAGRLAEWQVAGDDRLWKLIFSPEFGDRIDLDRLTRDVLKRIEQDTCSQLEWIAVVHHNTEHPHVHVALRGRTRDGRQLQFSRDYIKEGIRAIAEDYCTRQLGYRSELDAAEAERREVTEKRFTSLDRSIVQRAHRTESSWLSVTAGETISVASDSRRRHDRHVTGRLAVLRKHGIGAKHRALADGRCGMTSKTCFERCNAWRIIRKRSMLTEFSCRMNASLSRCSIGGKPRP